MLWINNVTLSRINYDVACNMDFHRYPVDEQYCEVKFESFGFSNKQVQHENRNISWLIFIIVFPDSNEMDGFLSQQCQPEHLPCSIFFQCPADGQLQHRLLWTVLPRTHNEGKIFYRPTLTLDFHEHEQKTNKKCNNI